MQAVLANEKSFGEFIADDRSNFAARDEYGQGVYHWWLQHRGEIPSNVYLVKLEQLAEQLPEAIAPYANKALGTIPHINKSDRKPWQQYYTPELKEIVQDKFKWTFARGLYDR